MRHLLLLFVVHLFLATSGLAQLQFSGLEGRVGTLYSMPKQSNVLANQKAIWGLQMAYSTTLTDSVNFPGWSVQPSLVFSRRGYNQKFDRTYSFRYMSSGLQILVGRQIKPWLLLQFGGEVCGIEVNTAGTNSNVTYTEYGVYSGHEFVLAGGFQLFNNRRISFYSQYVYGLTPLLRYQKIDKLGNFTGNIRDVYSRAVQLGFQVKIIKP